MEEGEGSRDSDRGQESDDANSVYSPSDQELDAQQAASDAESEPTSPPISPPASPIGSPPSSPKTSNPSSPVPSNPASPTTSPPASPTSQQNYSPASPINSPPASPVSPENSPPASPASPENSPPASPASRQNSPPASPASRQNSPPASPASRRNSPPASPDSRENSPPSSPITSPSSPIGSENAHQSEDEVHISEQENSYESDKEDKDHHREKVENESDAESDKEDSVPEINIDSGNEENNQASDSENEIEEGVKRNYEEKESDQVDDDNDCDKSLVIADDPPEGSSDMEVNVDSDDDGNYAYNKDSIEDTPRSPSPRSEGDKEFLSSPDEGKLNINEEEDKNESDNEENSESEESEVGELIADIFGESDEEDADFEGFGEEDLEAVKQKQEKRKKAAKTISDSEGEDEVILDVEENEEAKGEEVAEVPNEVLAPEKKQAVSDDDSDDDSGRKMREGFVSDFDLMMQKKKEENSRRRKRKDVDIINDSDDLIAEIIVQMRQAADEDRELNKLKRTATKKLKILPLVMSQLKKQDLRMAFLDQGVLNVMADWLAPLPDRSLPHLQIREGMIKRLAEFPVLDQSLLKSSGVGRALMYLFKHPRETKENRERAGKLITEWARPIFNVTTNFHSLTKEEREQRDFDHVPKKRKIRSSSPGERDEEVERKDIDKVLTGKETSGEKRPGEKGWIARARVPMPSTRDYVVRPKWNVEIELGRGPGKKPLNRFEKHLKTVQEKKKLSKAQRAVQISIEGRKMAI